MEVTYSGFTTGTLAGLHFTSQPPERLIMALQKVGATWDYSVLCATIEKGRADELTRAVFLSGVEACCIEATPDF